MNLTAHVTPAPIAYKPFAGIYNPYAYSCSLLCNHPADNDTREILRKAKYSFVSTLTYMLTITTVSLNFFL